MLGDLNVSLARLRAPEEIREAYQGVCEDASREVNRMEKTRSESEWHHPLTGVLRR